MKKSLKAPKRKSLSAPEIDALRARLQEAEETLDAIRSGQVEALVVASADGPRVFTLEGADHRYRRLVETMNEGALLLNLEGLILYANAAFAALVHRKLERVPGHDLRDFIAPESFAKYDALIAAAVRRRGTDELTLRGALGTKPIIALVSMSRSDDGVPGISAVVTNLTAQKQNEEILASERLARSILDQSVEAIIVCNEAGIVTRASRPAQEIATGQAVHQSVFTAFPVHSPVHPAERALKGEVTMGFEHELEVPGRGTIFVLCTAAPLVNESKVILGCVLSLVDITDRKRAEAERLELLDAERAARALAERARYEAETSNRSKDEFLATVSHELRTPLNAIVGWARLMSEGTLSAEKQQKGLDVIRRNADAQARLIEDLLDVSRIISGKMRIETRPVEPKAIIEAVLESVRPAVEAKQIMLERNLGDEPVTVLGDESRLQQVIWNLLSNAVKFTPRNGQIEIALKSDSSTVDVVVSDNGRGIAADFLPYVFDRFRQADGGINRAHGGLGLGLAISRHLAELHGGRIDVESEGANKGARFTLRLPIGLSSSPPSVSASKTPSSLPTREPTFEVTDLAGVNVLVVEDDHDSRELLVDILHTCGAQVRATDSGQDALELLEKAPSDVLISDVGMPRMNGYELIRRVRNLDDDHLRKLPALALTAYARIEDRRRALSEGFQMHLSKPIDPSELAAVVGRLVRR